VAVISYGFWQRHFGGDSDVLGHPLWLDGVAFTVIGITPPAFTGPNLGTAYDVAIPLGDEPLLSGGKGTLDRRGFFWLNVLARLRPGQSVVAATAALRGIQPQMRAATLPGWRADDLKNYLRDPFQIVPTSSGPSFLRGRYEKPLIALMVIVALVLLIACANIANVLLARAAARRHEMSVRLALGATRGRLLRQLLTESAVMSIAGAAVGLLVAKWGGGLLVRQISMQNRSIFLDLSLDWRVLTFTAAIAVATALVFGTAPALRGSAVAPNDALKESALRTAGVRHRSVLAPLVVAQVAMALVLLVGAGLFVRTFRALTHLPLGFDRDRVLVVDIDARRSHTTADAREALFQRIRDAVTAVPGVADAALSAVTPVSGSQWGATIDNPPGISLPERARGVRLNQISAAWFTTYGTALLAGRNFDARDRIGAPPVVIVNQAFARRFFPSATAVGRSIREVAIQSGQERPELRIVGVVQDAVYASVREGPTPTVYYPLAQAKELGPSMQLSLRLPPAAAASLERAVSAAVGGVDSNVAFTQRLLSNQIDHSLAQQRILAELSTFFGSLALLLAGIGLYGVMGYTISQRRKEIGIRMALGASPARVVTLILRRVIVLVGAGIAAGSVVSLWASRFAASLLFGLAPQDPSTLIGAAIVLGVVGAVAAWVPTHRASRIDPACVLREG
jgi:predicted permease